MTSAGHRNTEVLTPVIGIFGSLDLLLHFLKLSSVVIISLVILLAPLFGSATVVSTPTSAPISVKNPNGNLMQSTHVGELDFPGLPKEARIVHLFPSMPDSVLISIGVLCDAGCSGHFYARECFIYYQGKVVLYGTRQGGASLWHLAPAPKHSVNHLANATRPAFLPSSTKSKDVVAFMHAALGYPVISTLLKAVDKGYVHGFPGLTSRTLRLHPPFHQATVKGHQAHTRKNVQSTKPKPTGPSPPSAPSKSYAEVLVNDESFPDSDNPNNKTNFCYFAMHQITGQIASDLTGKFAIPSSQGNKYLLVVYDYDSNHIFAEPLPSRFDKSLLQAFKTIHRKLKAAGLTPKFQRLDNECSQAIKAYLAGEKIDFQLAPPNDHRRNAAERIIRIFKEHFISILMGCDPDFPLHLWCRLLPQALITLNLLRGSRINPKLSAYAQVYGTFDFNRTPIAPLGTRCLAHERNTTRTTWSPHAADAWYIGPALDSYRCFKVWIIDSRSERTADTVTWYPTTVHAPIPTTKDLILSAAKSLADAIKSDDADRTLTYLNDDQREVHQRSRYPSHQRRRSGQP